MIGVFEKILWGTSLFVIVVAVVVVVVAGPPAVTPQIQGKAVALNRDKFVEGLPAKVVQDIDDYIENGPPPAPGEDPKKKRRGRKRKAHYRAVDRAVYDRVSNLSRAIHEIRHLNSKVKKDKEGNVLGLEIWDFDTSHTLSKIGFEEKDLIEVIDGQRIDYSEGAATALFYACRDKMAAGEPIIIDVKRNGKPVSLVFSVK